LIYSPNGLLPIENLKKGDSVYSFNFDKRVIEIKPIINTISSYVKTIYELKVEDEIIKVTGAHPFYVVGKGWTRVQDLRVNDNLFSSEQKTFKIKLIKQLQEDTDVYNIEVADNNNYFVTKATFLVHNKNISFLQQLGLKNK